MELQTDGSLASELTVWACNVIEASDVGEMFNCIEPWGGSLDRNGEPNWEEFCSPKSPVCRPIMWEQRAVRETSGQPDLIRTLHCFIGTNVAADAPIAVMGNDEQIGFHGLVEIITDAMLFKYPGVTNRAGTWRAQRIEVSDFGTLHQDKNMFVGDLQFEVLITRLS